MANQVTNYKCPACTGPIHFVGATGKLQCDYCGNAYEVAEIEAMYEEKEQNAQEAFAREEARAADAPQDDKTDAREWDEAGMKEYDCPSCGAQLVCDETTVATSCPYCGNPTVVPGQFMGMLKPDYIIPFKLSQEQAKEALKKHYKGKRLLPSSFSSENRISEIKGVYVPFWMFDGDATVKARFKATRSRIRREGDYEVTDTEHYDVLREGTIGFERVPVDGSTKMPDEYMDAIEPFGYEDLKPFSSAYLPGYLADKYDVSAKECMPRVDKRVKATALNIIRNDVRGYTTCTMASSDLKLNCQPGKYALFPVYMLSTKWQDKVYMFAMNGQTGRMVGDLPVDKKKYWAYFGGITAGVTAVLGTILLMIL